MSDNPLIEAKCHLLKLEDRATLLQRVSEDGTGELAERSLILLYLDEGLRCEKISRTLNTPVRKIYYWRKRYLDCGLAALTTKLEFTKSREKTSTALIKKIIEKTLRELPDDGGPWTTRSMAQAVGVSASTVRRAWRRHGVTPHLNQGYETKEYWRLGKECDNVLTTYSAVGKW